MNSADRELLIRDMRPDAQNIHWVSSGHVNDVAVVDGRETFRFPRSEEGRKKLIYEFEVLKLLKGKPILAVPEPIELSVEKAFSVVSYIPGHPLTEHEVQSLPVELQIALGEAIGKFIIDLNTQVKLKDIMDLQPLVAEVESWNDWFNAMSKIANSSYAAIFKDYLASFQRIYPEGFSNGTTIIHDDLHAGNLIFDDRNKLTGVIDFGNVTIADIHRELRTIYRMGRHVFDAAVLVLQQRFGDINLETVRLCAVVYELAVLIEHESIGTPDSVRAGFANKLLDLWLGDDWRIS